MDGKRQQKEVYREKKKKNKVEEIQLANLPRPSQAITKRTTIDLFGVTFWMPELASYSFHLFY